MTALGVQGMFKRLMIALNRNQEVKFGDSRMLSTVLKSKFYHFFSWDGYFGSCTWAIEVSDKICSILHVEFTCQMEKLLLQF